ncbi:thiolase family protein [Arthrobacter bambusae]|uniref:thiolase family protein n=1 Tax=Arthrobacter bambusae TaxID=1338426 RepID=UPI00278A1DDC|nr:thiolase family protein [Arthrobacter bambusae]MDQ0032109.1 acetyl-CoA C-acetyltransferase [Arthrobacter bambusae]MDQ0100249.1 acetyl-CoA C-acetyltransferase [Arthrobacter bambusae]
MHSRELGTGLDPSRQAVIIAALRTPICRANGQLKSLRAEELLSPVLRSLLATAGVAGSEVSDVVIGNAVGGGGNLARYAALHAGLPVGVPGLTVDRQCGSGLDAIALASRLVAAGGNGVFLAGGVESISTAPLRARRNQDPDGEPDFYARATFVPPEFGDPDMGVAAENVAREFSISREQQDDFALRSHQRAVAARAAGVFASEIVHLEAAGAVVQADDGPRVSLKAGLMERFPPAFVPGGTVTAGNSCFDADAASAVVITSLQRARQLGAADGLLVLGCDTAGVDPELLGIGASVAAKRLLAELDLEPGKLDLVEFNEAFASQTLACLGALGVRPERANLDGGALALGHAFGASGAVLVTRLLAQGRRIAQSQPGRESLALAMISIAGGMGTAAMFRYAQLAAD